MSSETIAGPSTVAQLAPKIAEALRATVPTPELLAGPGFHGFDDIDTLVGLAGTYTWPEIPGLTRRITFVFDTDKVGFQGHYVIGNGLFPIEQGTFFCVPNNAAIGFAALALQPQAGATRAWVISGMITDLFGRITALLLGDFPAGGNPPATLFTAIRLF
jgi:hypothetical protein